MCSTPADRHTILQSSWWAQPDDPDITTSPAGMAAMQAALL